MASFKISTISRAVRCEICHQADCYDKEIVGCSRCAGLDIAELIASSQAKIDNQQWPAIKSLALASPDNSFFKLLLRGSAHFCSIIAIFFLISPAIVLHRFIMARLNSLILFVRDNY